MGCGKSSQAPEKVHQKKSQENDKQKKEEEKKQEDKKKEQSKQEQTKQEQNKTEQGKKEQAKPQSSAWNYKQEGKDWGLTGNQQSPINIEASQAKEVTDIKLFVDYSKSVYDYVLHPQHHYKLEGPFGSLELESSAGKRQYTAAQFHFHAPSEHTINGKFADLEVHIVHSNQSYPDFQNAVIGFMFKAGQNKNVFLDKVLNGASVCIKDLLTVATTTQVQQKTQILEVYHYKGSLTTPPCTENVNWFVYSKIIEAHSDQIKFFQRMWANNKHFAGGKGSNRVVQNLGNRQVLFIKA